MAGSIDIYFASFQGGTTFTVYVTACGCYSICFIVVLLSAQCGGSNGIEAQSLGPLFLQCFDTVGWVF